MEWNQVKGYDQLDEDQIQRLNLVYARHMEELDDPPKYAIENIVDIKRNQENYSVTLTFKND
ncbi:MAG: glutathione reductase, partial [Carnobacterium sp.]